MARGVPILLVWLVSAFVAGAAQGSESIRNIAAVPHGIAEGATLEEIGSAIVHAAGERQWYGGIEGPGTIVVTTVIRSHRATVTIGFDERSFWIDYRDSSNLDFNPNDLVRWDHESKGSPRIVVKGPRIHKNYNVWVRELADHVAFRAPAIALENRERAAPPGPALIADELDKLDRLRQRGVLTQAEFDAQKAKLLAR